MKILRMSDRAEFRKPRKDKGKKRVTRVIGRVVNNRAVRGATGALLTVGLMKQYAKHTGERLGAGDILAGATAGAALADTYFPPGERRRRRRILGRDF